MVRLKVRVLPWYLSWKGLLWERPHPILLKTRFGIHTFGMNYPIDVVILDETLVVRAIKQNLKPNSFFFWNIAFNTVVELPEDTIRKMHLQKGAKVVLETF